MVMWLYYEAQQISEVALQKFISVSYLLREFELLISKEQGFHNRKSHWDLLFLLLLLNLRMKLQLQIRIQVTPLFGTFHSPGQVGM